MAFTTSSSQLVAATPSNPGYRFTFWIIFNPPQGEIENDTPIEVIITDKNGEQIGFTTITPGQDEGQTVSIEITGLESNDDETVTLSQVDIKFNSLILLASTANTEYGGRIGERVIYDDTESV